MRRLFSSWPLKGQRGFYTSGPEEAVDLVVQLAKARFFEDRKFGVMGEQWDGLVA